MKFLSFFAIEELQESEMFRQTILQLQRSLVPQQKNNK